MSSGKGQSDPLSQAVGAAYRLTDASLKRRAGVNQPVGTGRILYSLTSEWGSNASRDKVAVRDLDTAMNEFSPLSRRPIELAIEAPFRLKSLQVTPAALELRREPASKTLEPRVMQVLVALHRTPNQAVSRDQLLDLCWEGRIVGDDSLNRCISQLRKALADEPGVAVDTIATIGYRLRIEDAAPERKAAAPPIDPPRPRNRRGFYYAGGGVLLLLALGAVSWFMTKPSELMASGLRPLTREAGLETQPALSPDGRRLAYAAGATFGAPRDLYLRGISMGDVPPARLTNTPLDDESAPVWSPDGDRIAFVRLKADGTCAILVMSPPNGAERAAGSCVDASSGLAWLNADTLVYGDRKPGERTRRLYAVDVVSGAVRALTSPPGDALGDAAPAVSSSGRWLAFRRTAALGSDDLFLLDSKSGVERRLTNGGWKAIGFAWSGDETSLFFTSNRGGDFGLWALDVTRSGEPRRISLGMMPLGRMSVDREGNVLAVEAARFRSHLTAIAANGALTPITTGNGADWDPDIAPNHAIVFGSDQSGTNEIWVKRADAAPSRLTQLEASYVHSPRWSADGSRIAFIAVVDGRTDIYEMRADGAGLIKLTQDGAAKGRVAWTGQPGQIIFSEWRQGGWSLFRLDNASRSATPVTGSAGIAIVERWGDRLYARKAGESRLLELDPGSGVPRPMASPIEVEDMEGWAPGPAGIFQLRKADGAHLALWFTPWTGSGRQIAIINALPRPNLSVAPSGNVVMPQPSEDESDLMLIDIRKSRGN